MKRKFLYTAAVALIMGTAHPVHAAPYQVMYNYKYYDDGVWVGEQNDLCTRNGVVTQGQYVWGYGTNDVEVTEWIGCEEGQWVPLQ